MSDTSTTVLFEHPLNEKMRTWLRIDFLLQQLQQHRHLQDITGALAFFEPPLIYSMFSNVAKFAPSC